MTKGQGGEPSQKGHFYGGSGGEIAHKGHLYTVIFAFYCSFKNHFFEKISKTNVLTPIYHNFCVLSHFKQQFHRKIAKIFENGAFGAVCPFGAKGTFCPRCPREAKGRGAAAPAAPAVPAPLIYISK